MKCESCNGIGYVSQMDSTVVEKCSKCGASGMVPADMEGPAPGGDSGTGQ